MTVRCFFLTDACNRLLRLAICCVLCMLGCGSAAGPPDSTTPSPKVPGLCPMISFSRGRAGAEHRAV